MPVFGSFYSSSTNASYLIWNGSGISNIVSIGGGQFQLNVFGVYEITISGSVLMATANTPSSVSVYGLSNTANGTIIWYNSGVSTANYHASISWSGFTRVSATNTLIYFTPTNLGNPTYYTYITIKFISV